MTKLYDADFSSQQDGRYFADGSGGTALTNGTLGAQKEVTILLDFQTAAEFVSGEILSMGPISISINEAGRAVFHTPSGDVVSEYSARDGTIHQVELTYDTERGYMTAKLDGSEVASASASVPIIASSLEIGKTFVGWIDNVRVNCSGETVDLPVADAPPAPTATVPPQIGRAHV